MNNFAQCSDRLIAALELANGPVGVTVTQQPLNDHAKPSEAVAAGCKFWELGASTALATTAEDHANCAIGVYTHNMAGAPDTQPIELMHTLAAMRGLDYVQPGEVETIPAFEAESQCICYTPLAQCRERPATVLLFADARQGLIITEAVARVDDAIPPAWGRPACGVIPQVVNSGLSAASLGCCGARAYIDRFGDDVTLWALNGEHLENYVESIEVLSRANRTLTQYHLYRKEDFATGQSPTVQQSLDRLAGGD
jgi:uncharacterized protein (DUF169 family)